MSAPALPALSDDALNTPRTADFGQAIAFVIALGHEDKFGGGTQSSPWFPIDVQLTGPAGVDGNANSIIGRVRTEVSTYLRRSRIERPWRDNLEKAVGPELRASHSYEELLARVLRMVRVH